jgi:hypothetical protein
MCNKALSIMLALAFGGCVVACGGGDDDDVIIVEEDDVVVDPVGQLTVLWSIDGTTDPGACDFYGADRLELVIFDEVALKEEIESPARISGSRSTSSMASTRRKRRSWTPLTHP